MRLVYSTYNFEITFIENNEMVLYLENPKVFSEIVKDIWNQMNDGEAKFILSDDDKELNFGKEGVLIINPFSVSCNEKKILTKLYQEMEEIAMEKYFVELTELNRRILLLLENLSQDTQYQIEYKDNFVLANCLKNYSVQIDSESENLLEQLIDYIKVSHRILKKQIFVFVNLKMYLDESELLSLYETCHYEKVFLLLIEGNYSGVKLKGEKSWIWDKDYCIIELSELTTHRPCESSVRTEFEV